MEIWDIIAGLIIALPFFAWFVLVPLAKLFQMFTEALLLAVETCSAVKRRIRR
jgi:hypothetical protein